jgi:hypothetical protein
MHGQNYALKTDAIFLASIPFLATSSVRIKNAARFFMKQTDNSLLNLLMRSLPKVYF